MKTLRIIFLVSIVSLFANNLKAQTLNFDLQVSNMKLGSSSSAIISGSSDSLYFTLSNNGTDSFVNGGGATMLRFFIYVDTMVLNPTPFSYQLIPQDSFDIAIPAILNPGDSIQLRTFIQFPPTIYTKYKDNEIVIWPKFQPNEASPLNNSTRLFVHCYGSAMAQSSSISNNLITAFPNPFNDKIKIEIDDFKSNYQYELFDMAGNVVYHSSTIGNKYFTIDFKNMDACEGIYLVRIFDDKKSRITKIIYAK